MQEEALDVATDGHDLLVTGQAGTGKSFFLKKAIRSFQNQGKNSFIVLNSSIINTNLTFNPSFESQDTLPVTEVSWRIDL